jgi:hypothetical protein
VVSTIFNDKPNILLTRFHNIVDIARNLLQNMLVPPLN